MSLFNKYFFLIVLFSSCCLGIFAQITFPKSFNEKLNQMDVDIAIPVEQSYRNKRLRKNEFFHSDHAIRSKRNKIEIHYSLSPEQEFLIPNVQTTAMVSNLARNEEAYATIAIHQLKEKDLMETFNADWGSVAYFQPKRSFSRFRYGKLLSLYKSGKGMIHVLFLFDKANEAVNHQFYAARFNT